MRPLDGIYFVVDVFSRAIVGEKAMPDIDSDNTNVDDGVDVNL